MQIKTRPVQISEFQKLIEFDDAHLQRVMNETGVPVTQLAPSLTIDELEKAYERKDILEWIVSNTNNIIGYFWLEKKTNNLYINGIAIQKEFQGQGIVQYILNFAEGYARKNDLLECTLSVHPLNGRALNVYLKQGYIIVDAVSSFFGSKYPDSFRLILKKDLSKNSVTYSNELNEIPCNDNIKLKNAIENGYIGIKLIKENNNYANKICLQKKYRNQNILNK